MSNKRLIVLLPASLVLAGLSLGAGGCPTQLPDGLTGDSAAGATLFSQECAGCHSVAFLKPRTNLIISNLGALDSDMNGLTLTAQEIADLKAYLAEQ